MHNDFIFCCMSSWTEFWSIIHALSRIGNEMFGLVQDVQKLSVWIKQFSALHKFKFQLKWLAQE